MDFATMTVSEVVTLSPGTTAVFNRHGIDTCCGGDKAVQVAASLHGVDLAALLAELAAVAPAAAGASAPAEQCRVHA